MIVEFIGSTGAGKTTLIRAVEQRLAETTRVTDATSLVIGRLGRPDLRSPTVQNLLQELAGLPFFVWSLPGHWKLIHYCLRMYSRKSLLSMATVNNLRSLLRKIGTHEICKRRADHQIVLLDEGPLLLAHTFAFGGAVFSFQDLADFVGRVPLSDRVVYVRCPVEDVLRRTLQRRDVPRELRGKDPLVIEQTLRQALAIFEGIAQDDHVRNRMLVVENPGTEGRIDQTIVDCVAEFILSNEPSPMVRLTAVQQV